MPCGINLPWMLLILERGWTCCLLLVARYFLSVTRHFLLVTCYLFACCSLLFARCSLLFARCLLLFARCSLVFVCCSSLFARCLLFFACCSLVWACCSLFFARFSLLFARCSLFYARCSLLLAHCWLGVSTYRFSYAMRYNDAGDRGWVGGRGLSLIMFWNSKRLLNFKAHEFSWTANELRTLVRVPSSCPTTAHIYTGKLSEKIILL